jgi:hypothetical protein
LEQLSCNGFAIQKRFRNSKEENAVITYCISRKIPYKFCKKTNERPDNFIPVGTVEWCESFLQKTVPDYYPKFLENFLYRKVWKTNVWSSERVFIKPADNYKRFTGFVTTKRHKSRQGPFWCSEVVEFVNEWRYYVSNGKVLAAEWYDGDDINTPDAPKLNIDLKNFYGALDFGILKTGELALVEAQHPYACGWYGDIRNFTYVEWLIEGWNWMIKNKLAK